MALPLDRLVETHLLHRSHTVLLNSPHLPEVTVLLPRHRHQAMVHHLVEVPLVVDHSDPRLVHLAVYHKAMAHQADRQLLLVAMAHLHHHHHQVTELHRLESPQDLLLEVALDPSAAQVHSVHQEALLEIQVPSDLQAAIVARHQATVLPSPLHLRVITAHQRHRHHQVMVHLLEDPSEVLLDLHLKATVHLLSLPLHRLPAMEPQPRHHLRVTEPHHFLAAVRLAVPVLSDQHPLKIMVLLLGLLHRQTATVHHLRPVTELQLPEDPLDRSEVRVEAVLVHLLLMVLRLRVTVPRLPLVLLETEVATVPHRPATELHHPVDLAVVRGLLVPSAEATALHQTATALQQSLREQEAGANHTTVMEAMFINLKANAYSLNYFTNSLFKY